MVGDDPAVPLPVPGREAVGTQVCGGPGLAPLDGDQAGGAERLKWQRTCGVGDRYGGVEREEPDQGGQRTPIAGEDVVGGDGGVALQARLPRRPQPVQYRVHLVVGGDQVVA